jgi:hypothetical protein
MTYRADGPVVGLTSTGEDTYVERQFVYDAILSDPKVPDGAYLILDLLKYAVLLTQSELERRARPLLETLGPKIARPFAVVVRDTSMRLGLGLKLAAGNMEFLVAIFHEEETARRWLSARP